MCSSPNRWTDGHLYVDFAVPETAIDICGYRSASQKTVDLDR